MTRTAHYRVLGCLALLAAACSSGDSLSAGAGRLLGGQIISESQAAAAATTILDLQAFARSTTAAIEASDGRRGTATLVELNPKINAWFLLRLSWEDAQSSPVFYHLENSRPQESTVELDRNDLRHLRLSSNGRIDTCDLWWSGPDTALERARRSSAPYAAVCNERLYLRNTVPGTYTQLERTTNFLRDHIWGGDRIVTFVREQFFRDEYVEKGVTRSGTARPPPSPPPETAPRPADVNPVFADDMLVPEHLALDLGPVADAVVLGQWYGVRDSPGIFVSAIQPRAIAPQILDSHRARVQPLDPVEGEALDYLVAFDLATFDLGFALGTDHPRLDWSPRVPNDVRDPARMGPDGINTAAPLVRNGIVNPAFVARTAATFTGGFKREHGAFHRGELALRNAGSHYGFIEQGTVFSRLQPGLATLLVLDDGWVEMKTWSASDTSVLPRIKHARQNGVPLIEADPLTGAPTPGALVNQWGAGNWSGSADEKLRTLRAGVCLQQTPTRRFLIYGYFSTATPSAMTRAFQAYDCRYAMHLDMNALEHTYLAVYTRAAGSILIQHLVDAMAVLDRKVGREPAPRFLAFPDNRDFFYLLRRQSAP